jgi:uncharacterized protein
MLSSQDFEIVTKQLGRRPIGALEVSVRDQLGQAVVIMVDPLAEGKPFPSLYWLSCPKMHKAIADIERTAWIKNLENNVLPGSSDLKRRLQEDNKNYRDQRWELFLKLHPNHRLKESYLKVIRESGIGGIQKFDRVRCLHMHYAYHLVHGGVVGELLDQEFDLKSNLLTGES